MLFVVCCQCGSHTCLSLTPPTQCWTGTIWSECFTHRKQCKCVWACGHGTLACLLLALPCSCGCFTKPLSVSHYLCWMTKVECKERIFCPCAQVMYNASSGTVIRLVGTNYWQLVLLQRWWTVMIDSIVLHKFPVGLSVQEASATKNGSTHTKAATELPTTTICHKYNEVVVCNNLHCCSLHSCHHHHWQKSFLHHCQYPDWNRKNLCLTFQQW